jgi:hypothetical protein
VTWGYFREVTRRGWSIVELAWIWSLERGRWSRGLRGLRYVLLSYVGSSFNVQSTENYGNGKLILVQLPFKSNTKCEL